MKKLIHKIKWKKLIKYVIIIVVLVTIIFLGYQKFFVKKSTSASTQASYTTEKVETRTIQNVLSSSGTIEPLNTYDVTCLVQGEVITADFEEGDEVEKGQVLYQIATDDVDNEIDTAKVKVTRAEKELTKAKDNYSDALDNLKDATSDYEEAKSIYGNGKIVATYAGNIKTLYVKEGDTLQKGAQIAEIYDNSYMLLKVPFSSSDVSKSLVGEAAQITIDSSFEAFEGTVTEVNSEDQVLSGNRLVKYVTIKVKNPGGITESTSATAIIGEAYSADEGTFTPVNDTTMTSKASGEIASIKVDVGDTVSKGDVILTLTQNSVDDMMSGYLSAVDNAQKSVDNASDSVEAAEASLEDAQDSLDNTIDTKADYSITAPISGKVVSKNTLEGDTIKSTDFNSTLCTIYDLSAVTFSMSVDELDVLNVKEGQEVEITADALDGVTFTGTVTNVSIESSASNGVTQYPITVRIDDSGELLPGMNVTGNIIIEEAENCIAIPSDALQRGNVVYVKDASVTEATGNVPAGFKEVTVETGITDGDYVQITNGLDGTEEVYVARPISTESATQEQGPFGDFNFGGQDGQMPQPGNGGGGNWGGNRNSSGWSGNRSGSGNFGGPMN